MLKPYTYQREEVVYGLDETFDEETWSELNDVAYENFDRQLNNLEKDYGW